MDKTIESLSEALNASLKRRTSKWYNGHAYMPLYVYSLQCNYNSAQISIRYEYRQSEFTKSTIMNTSTEFQDRHLCKIKTGVKTNKHFSKIDIRFLRAFERLFSKRKLKLKGDQALQQAILASTVLDELSDLVAQSSDFDPQIVGTQKEDEYELSCHFNTSVKPFRHIELLLDLYKDILRCIA